MTVLRLKKDLVRDIKRGHPWVFLNALETPRDTQPGFAKLVDKKGQFLAWGVFDPQSTLAFRVISLENAQVTPDRLLEKLKWRVHQKSRLFDASTTGIRLLHGEGDGFSGLVMDRFSDVAVVQTDGDRLDEVWPLENFAKVLLEEFKLKSVIFKPQKSTQKRAKILAGIETPDRVPFLENDLKFEADVQNGQKTGFFLDQRNSRALVKKVAADKTVLNLFSYTGGFSVAAGAGGAMTVESVDLSPFAIEGCTRHWIMNGLPPTQHTGVTADVFEYLKNQKKFFDLVIVDPPSFASSQSQVAKAREAYIHAFSQSAQRVADKGFLALSSCSSHIDFEMFYEICIESVSRARRRATVIQVLGQPEDHPFPLACPELRYLKFFLLQL